ncbi:MAG: NusA-like transcription termination signal-binding factor [archaeon]
MGRIRYDVNLMNYMSLFESVTRTRAKDCLVDRNKDLIFIVHEGQIGKAIGKGAVHIRRLTNLLKKKIRLIESASSPEDFLRNIVAPLQIVSVENQDGVLVVKGPDMKTKGLLMGRNLQNLRETESIVQRFFDIRSVKVV